MSVMISINPKWCLLIANGQKVIEVRKNKPKLQTPFKCFIYCTEGEALAYPHLNNRYFHLMRTNNGSPYGKQMTVEEREMSDSLYANKKVIGEFICDYVYHGLSYDSPNTCVSAEELKQYASGKPLYGWHISDLKIYDEPKELSEFHRECEEPECGDCPYLHFENTPDSYEGWCIYNKKIPITRPPQSWCYVEGKIDGK